MRRFGFVLGSVGLVVAGHAAAAQFEILGAMPGESPPSHLARTGIYSFEQPRQGALPTLEITRIAFATPLPAGSIIVNTRQRQLYLVLPNQHALVYPVGVGREGFAWSGTDVITAKAIWPAWRPTAEMIAREADTGTILPDHMPGGPLNPLGARALYIGDTAYRIHGTTQPWSIGRNVSSGCIRMLNAHVIDLFDRVEIGARIIVE
jgi:lipoprotein-anchoring transpeptidase ErfK/SrfK